MNDRHDRLVARLMALPLGSGVDDLTVAAGRNLSAYLELADDESQGYNAMHALSRAELMIDEAEAKLSRVSGNR